MPIHRDLSLKTSVHGISPELFQRYFQRLPSDQLPSSAWTYLNSDAMEQFLADLHDVEANAALLEDFQCINDIALHSANLVVQAYHHARIDFEPELSAQELAMRLFLDHPDAFKYAWSGYLFYSTDAKLASYSLPLPQLDIGDREVGNLQVDLSRYFASQAKGSHCNVRWYQGSNQSTLYIQPGSYLWPLPHWRDGRVEVTAFRPATEDLLVYNPSQP